MKVKNILLFISGLILLIISISGGIYIMIEIIEKDNAFTFINLVKEVAILCLTSLFIMVSMLLMGRSFNL